MTQYNIRDKLVPVTHETHEAVIGEITDACARSGYTRGQIADMAGVSKRTVNYILAGGHSPRLDNLLSIMQVVGMRISVSHKQPQTGA